MINIFPDGKRVIEEADRREREKRFRQREDAYRRYPGDFGQRDMAIYQMRDHFQHGLHTAGWNMLRNRMEFEAYAGEVREQAYFVVASDGVGAFEVVVLERRDIGNIERIFKNPYIVERGIWINRMPPQAFIYCNDIVQSALSTEAWYEHWALLKQLWDDWERDNRS
jgi:hypothetical protein